MKYAIYVIVVEDTNAAAEAIADLPVGTSDVEAILEVETEEEAINTAADMVAYGKSR